MRLSIRHAATGTVVALRGKLDDMVIAELRPELEQTLRDSPTDVYMDLRSVTYIDAAAIGALAFLFKRLAARRWRLKLVCSTGQPRRLLELLRIDRTIEIGPSLPAALVPELSERAA